MKPTRVQMDIALAEAERLRDGDEDTQHLAKCLLYMERRNEVLEELLETVEHYLNSGHAPHEHSLLIKAVDAARHQIWEEGAAEPSRFGL
jgi:hypothetical protein